MKIKVFEHRDMAEQERAVNEFLAQDGRTIAVDKIFTAAGGDRYSVWHYITVLYMPLEQADTQ